MRRIYWFSALGLCFFTVILEVYKVVKFLHESTDHAGDLFLPCFYAPIINLWFQIHQQK